MAPRYDLSKPMLTPKEVAALLSISVYKLQCMAKRGEIPAVKLGGQWRFRPADVESLLGTNLLAREQASEARA